MSDEFNNKKKNWITFESAINVWMHQVINTDKLEMSNNYQALNLLLQYEWFTLIKLISATESWEWCSCALKSHLGDNGTIVSLLLGDAMMMMEDRYDVLGCKSRWAQR